MLETKIKKLKKKILFVGVNSSYSHTMLSYGHIRAYTEMKCPDFNWDYIETTIKEDEETFFTKVLEREPDIIIATSYIFNQNYLMGILKRIYAVKGSTQIYLGGPEFLGDNEQFLRLNSEISAVIRGDESSFHQILKNNYKDWKSIPGACYIDYNNNYKDNGLANYIGELDQLPSLYKLGYFLKGKPFYQLETSRGCNGSCTFCTSSISKSVRYFSLERIHSDLTTLKCSGVKEVRIVDRTFNADKERAISMLKMFRNDFNEINFHLEVNPAMLSKEILEEMKKAPKNQLHIEIGVQTFNDKCLKLIKRPATASKQLLGMKELLRLNNFEIHADLIAGLPTQTYSDVIEDLKTMINVAPHEIQLENLKMLPGTPLTKNAPKTSSWNPHPPYEILKTDTMTVQELQRTRYLSKMIDSYLNTTELNSCFIYAFNTIPNFLDLYLNHIIMNCDPLQKYSMKKRFELFMKFTQSYSNTLQELLNFTWLAIGGSPDRFNVKVRKIHPDMPKGELVWKSPKNGRGKRYFIIKFNSNIADIWLNPYTKNIETKHIYLFEMLHGHSVTRIESLTK